MMMYNPNRSTHRTQNISFAYVEFSLRIEKCVGQFDG